MRGWGEGVAMRSSTTLKCCNQPENLYRDVQAIKNMVSKVSQKVRKRSSGPHEGPQ